MSNGLSVLVDATRLLGTAKTVADVYRHALDAIQALSGADRASILLFDADGVLRFKAWRGLGDGYRAAVEGHTPWSPGQPAPEPILVPDAASPAADLGRYRDTILGEGIRALAFLPLVTGGGTIGKFMLYRGAPHVEDPATVQLLLVLAANTAFAVDRLRAVEALERERSLFVGGPTMVFRWRSTEGWPVEYVSPNITAVLGLMPAELLEGRVAYASLVHPDDLARVVEEVVQNSAARVASFEQEYRLRRADGSWRWMYDFTVPVRDADGNVTHFLGYLVDQTERRAAMDALHANQRLESLGLLAGGVAHDFNNLLQGLGGNLQLALRALADGRAGVGPAHPALEYLQDAMTAATRASELTQQLLAYTGRGMAAMVPVDVSALVSECLRMMGSHVAGRAQLVTDLDPVLPAVLADATQLRQVIVNLLTNAVDALPGGGPRGTVTVRTRAERGATGAATHVVLEVQDTGEGMDDATRARIFEPFFSTRGTGRGLGLSAVQGLARAHHGEVTVESVPGKGSTFRVRLPAHQDAPPARITLPPRTPTPVAVPVAAGTRVLVVDDDAGVRRMAERCLQLAGCGVEVAPGAEPALELLERGPLPDVVVMDVTMPGMDGMEALRRIRARWPRLPVILCSGYALDSMRGVREDAVTRFLGKPYAPEALEAAVRRFAPARG